MCLISPVPPRKKPSKNSSKPATSSPGPNSHPASRIVNNTTTSHSQTLELPTSHLPPCLTHKAPCKIPTIQITPATADTPSTCICVDQRCITASVCQCTTSSSEIPALTISNCLSPDDNTHLSIHRASALSDIDFVQTLSKKLNPPAATPKGPSESEKKMQDEIKKIGDAMRKREREEEIAAAVSKAKTEVAKKEKDNDAQKAQQQSCNTGPCTCCPQNASSRTNPGQDGFVFHIHTHQDGISHGSDGMSDCGLEYVGASAAALYERRRSSVENAAVGIARRMLDRVRGIEARTAMLEMEVDMGWERDRERDLERERRRQWDRDRERYRHLGGTRGMGYF